ncbi:MAG: hypothetical protein ACI30R_03580 [Sodaliphilus sp.]
MWESVYYKLFDEQQESAFVHNEKSLPYCVKCSSEADMLLLKRQLKHDGFRFVDCDGDGATFLVNLNIKKWCKKPTNIEVSFLGDALHAPAFFKGIYRRWKETPQMPPQ